MTVSVTLTLKADPRVPVEAESLNPDSVAGKSQEEIGNLPLLVGKTWETVADWFEVAMAGGGEDAGPEDAGQSPHVPELVLRGDLGRFKRLGEGMARGRMLVEGPVGFHAGARMRGGSLTIHGDAADFLGAHMAGGLLVVRGHAGHYAASAYRGHTQGMTGGTIVITGNAGQMLGARMRRGLIYVLGDSGDVTGFNMKAGTIIVAGTPGARVGARMVRGSVILLGGSAPLLPTFCYDCTHEPGFWAPLHKHLDDLGFAPPAGPRTVFRQYSGDVNEGGRGEVLLRTSPLDGGCA